MKLVGLVLSTGSKVYINVENIELIKMHGAAVDLQMVSGAHIGIKGTLEEVKAKIEGAEQ